ncbi:hypothetical protein D3C75_415240 [compost metagenome]
MIGIMLKKRFRFGTSILALAFSLSVITGGVGVSASGIDNTEDYIPEGFTVTKVYNETDPEYFVKDKKASVFTPDTLSSFVESAVDGDESTKVEIKTLEDKTYKLRDIKNLETGEEATQYRTDVSIMALQSDDKYDPTGGVKLTITIYSTDYDNDMYTAMDKVYVRWDREDSTISSATSTLAILQVGPAKSGSRMDQKIIDDNDAANPWNISFGNTYLFQVNSYGWEPVLKSGAFTQVGAKIYYYVKTRVNHLEFYLWYNDFW